MNDQQRFTFYFMFLSILILGGGYYLLAFQLFPDTYYENFSQERFSYGIGLSVAYLLLSLGIVELFIRPSKNIFLKRSSTGMQLLTLIFTITMVIVLCLI